MALEETTRVAIQPLDKSKIMKIWRIALILFIITAFEFFCAYTLPRGIYLIVIFVVMTLVKAFYIVSEFMHLKHEVKVMIWSILLPMIFVVFAIFAFIYEGGAILSVR